MELLIPPKSFVAPDPKHRQLFIEATLPLCDGEEQRNSKHIVQLSAKGKKQAKLAFERLVGVLGSLPNVMTGLGFDQAQFLTNYAELNRCSMVVK